MKRTILAAQLLLAALLLWPSTASAQKKPLDHDVYDSWESVSSLKLTDDGRIVAYQIRPQQGDSRLVFRNLENGNHQSQKNAQQKQMENRPERIPVHQTRENRGSRAYGRYGLKKLHGL